jgi:hypothetical protein
MVGSPHHAAVRKRLLWQGNAGHRLGIYPAGVQLRFKGYIPCTALIIESLIEDIKTDIKVASESLKRVDYASYKEADFFT